MTPLYSILYYALEIYTFIIFIRIIGSWLPGIHNYPIMRYIADVTDPVLRPLRRILPTFAGLDFAPLALLILIMIAQELLRTLLVS